MFGRVLPVMELPLLLMLQNLRLVSGEVPASVRSARQGFADLFQLRALKNRVAAPRHATLNVWDCESILFWAAAHRAQ